MEIQPMTDEQIEILAETMMDVEAAISTLPEDEQRKYQEAQQSVVDARRAGEILLRTDNTIYC